MESDHILDRNSGGRIRLYRINFKKIIGPIKVAFIT
ncbi:Hypothetical protein CCH01_004030 [Clostridium chauvoei JF4335]|uniref:Uncharacterized protein n=1 Tax=Clostridium chauvoei JF4335 TaxID=1351755 RepID=S6EIS8_9CLOT|nr:Hypothetical protein CCH01_004030 [Clostridium chauvoei JF4335]SLK14608.1 Hypothetical protein CCH01_07210 [Clostridium chauvoei JF4335]